MMNNKVVIQASHLLSDAVAQSAAAATGLSLLLTGEIFRTDTIVPAKCIMILVIRFHNMVDFFKCFECISLCGLFFLQHQYLRPYLILAYTTFVCDIGIYIITHHRFP